MICDNVYEKKMKLAGLDLAQTKYLVAGILRLLVPRRSQSLFLPPYKPTVSTMLASSISTFCTLCSMQ